jgi:hypothetical protein
MGGTAGFAKVTRGVIHFSVCMAGGAQMEAGEAVLVKN